MASMIQVAHLPGQPSVGMSMTRGEYVVSFGLQVEQFRRTPSGLIAAVKKFEEFYSEAMLLAANDMEQNQNDD